MQRHEGSPDIRGRGMRPGGDGRRDEPGDSSPRDINRLLLIAAVALQCSWGLVQTALGALAFCVWARGRRRYRFRASLVTEWGRGGGLSLGAFVFVPPRRDTSLVVHEYGHTLQSLILGPLYLLVVGLPSALWANFPPLRRLWASGRVSYYSFLPERWANRLGELVCEEPAPR